MAKQTQALWQKDIILEATLESFRKLDPRTLWKNPVMFMVELGSVLTTAIAVRQLFTGAAAGFSFHISIWLWFTVLFANFSTALAEGRGKAQAESLKRAREETFALRVAKDNTTQKVASLDLRRGDVIIVDESDTIPGDGEIIEGTALINLSLIHI